MTTMSTPPFPASSGSHVMPARPAEPSWVARAPENLGRLAWRWRWQLAPVAGAGGVLTCGVAAPGSTLIPLAAVTAGVEVWRRRGWVIAGRKVLSDREKLVAMQWGAGASAWSLASLAHPSPLLGGALLVGATGWQSYEWGRSRVPKRRKLSPAAKAIMMQWDGVVAVHGPGELRGAFAQVRTAVEPGPGAVSFVVKLPGDVHATAAAGEPVRLQVERLMGLPMDTVRLLTDRSDSGLLRVTISPERHLEAMAVPWTGSKLRADGSVDVAKDETGRDIAIHIHNDRGVEHGMISGTSDGGKSITTGVVLLAEPLAGIGRTWLFDGKRGTSAPYLAPACDWYMPREDQWGVGIEAAHAVMLARQERRGDAGLFDFDVPNEPEGTLTLVFDEATTIANKVKPRHHEMVLDILREGRALGVRVVQIAQDVMADGLIGGRKARDLMAGNGFVIAHRPGGTMAGRLTLDSTSPGQAGVNIDLTALPPEAGFAAIVRKGKVLAGVARVQFGDPGKRHAPGPIVAAAMSVTPRPLEGEDELAAGAAYLARHSGTVPAGDADVEEPEQTAEQAAQSDDVLLRILADADGLTLAQVEQHPDWQWSRRTASNSLMRLSRVGRVEKSGAVWSAARVESTNTEGE